MAPAPPPPVLWAGKGGWSQGARRGLVTTPPWSTRSVSKDSVPRETVAATPWLAPTASDSMRHWRVARRHRTRYSPAASERARDMVALQPSRSLRYPTTLPEASTAALAVRETGPVAAPKPTGSPAAPPPSPSRIGPAARGPDCRSPRDHHQARELPHRPPFLVAHLLEDNHDIRTVQELRGHTDVSTTMIYPHVLSLGPGAVRSPADRIFPV